MFIHSAFYAYLMSHEAAKTATVPLFTNFMHDNVYVSCVLQNVKDGSALRMSVRKMEYFIPYQQLKIAWACVYRIPTV